MYVMWCKFANFSVVNKKSYFKDALQKRDITQQRQSSMPNVTLYTRLHTRLTALCPGLPGWAGTRKVQPIWILPKQETVSGSGISLPICKSAPRSRQITMPAPHHSSFFYRPDALPAAQPTASKHWRQKNVTLYDMIMCKSAFSG